MAEAKDRQDIKEYADGWITEREHTDVPAFLKFSYIVIAFGCIAYSIIYMNGESTHATRGPLVQQFVEMTSTANGVMYFVAALTAVFAVVLVMFAFGKEKD
jgi:hypothetical protein